MTEKQFEVICAALADAIIKRDETIENQALDIRLLKYDMEKLKEANEEKKEN